VRSTTVAATEVGLRHVVLQREREVAEAYRVYGTPGAVLIVEGRIASRVAQGSADIRALISDFFDARPQPALGIGDEVPSAPIETVVGTKTTLTDVVSHDAVLLFWNPQCGYCDAMLADLRAWEADRTERRVQLIVISAAPFDATSAGLASPTFVDLDSKISATLGIAGTPMAVRIHRDRRITSTVAAGKDAVLTLLTQDATSQATL
jgi:thiol-disulfide isomerase/thioredoxin